MRSWGPFFLHNIKKKKSKKKNQVVQPGKGRQGGWRWLKYSSEWCLVLAEPADLLKKKKRQQKCGQLTSEKQVNPSLCDFWVALELARRSI